MIITTWHGYGTDGTEEEDRREATASWDDDGAGLYLTVEDEGNGRIAILLSAADASELAGFLAAGGPATRRGK